MTLESDLRRDLTTAADIYINSARLADGIADRAKRRVRRRRAVLAVAGIATAMVLAVTVKGLEEGPVRPTPSDKVTTGKNLAITLPSPTDDDPLIPVVGTLSVVKDCLLLNSTLVMWPYGTSWEVGANQVRLENRQTLVIGDRVEGTGGIRDLAAPLPASFGESTNAAIRACEELTDSRQLAILYNAKAK